MDKKKIIKKTKNFIIDKIDSSEKEINKLRYLLNSDDDNESGNELNDVFDPKGEKDKDLYNYYVSNIKNIDNKNDNIKIKEDENNTLNKINENINIINKNLNENINIINKNLNNINTNLNENNIIQKNINENLEQMNINIKDFSIKLLTKLENEKIKEYELQNEKEINKLKDILNKEQEERKRKEEAERKRREEEQKRREEERKERERKEKEERERKEQEQKRKEEEDKRMKIEEEEERKRKENEEMKKMSKEKEEVMRRRNAKVKKYARESNDFLNKYLKKIDNFNKFEMNKHLKGVLDKTIENIKKIDDDIIQKIIKNEDYNSLKKFRLDLYKTIDDLFRKQQDEVDKKNKLSRDKADEFKKEHEANIEKMKNIVNEYRNKDVGIDGYIKNFDEVIEGYKKNVDEVHNEIYFDKKNYEKGIDFVNNKAKLLENLVDQIKIQYKANKDKQEEERKRKEEEEKKRKEEEERKRKEEQEYKKIQEKMKNSEEKLNNIKKIIEQNEINLTEINYTEIKNMLVNTYDLYTEILIAIKLKKDINEINKLFDEFSNKLINLEKGIKFLKEYTNDDVIMRNEYEENKKDNLNDLDDEFKRNHKEIETKYVNPDYLFEEFKKDLKNYKSEKILNDRKNKLLDELFNRRVNKYWSDNIFYQEELRQKKIDKIMKKYVDEYNKKEKEKSNKMTDKEIAIANEYKKKIINNTYYGTRQPEIVDKIYLYVFDEYKNDPGASSNFVKYMAERMDECVLKYQAMQIINSRNINMTEDDKLFIRNIIFSKFFSNEQKEDFLSAFLNKYEEVKPLVMYEGGSIKDRYLDAIIKYRSNIIKKDIEDLIKQHDKKELYKKNYEENISEINDILNELDTDKNIRKRILDILNKPPIQNNNFNKSNIFK